MREKRNGGLDFWKFVFSIVVVLCHSVNMAGKKETLFINKDVGVVAVEFFFFVSGILMANSAAKNADAQLSLGQDTLHFMKKKVCGLMPNIYIAFVIAFIVEHIGNFSPVQMLKDAVSAIWELLLLSEAGLYGYRANKVSWYLSAMLLAMFLIYPLIKKYKDTYFYIIAPITVIFLMGISYQEWKNYSQPHAWFGIAFKSLYRALMGIMIGNILYKIGMHLRSVEFTRLARAIFTFVEWGCYAIVILSVYVIGGSKADWILVILLAVPTMLTFAQVSLPIALFSNTAVCRWLGEYSFSLFLGHGFWSRRFSDIFPNLTYMQKLPIYFGFSFATGLFIMYSSLVLRKWWDKNKETLAAKFIVKE